ncbi:MAG TPA: tetratricopeptide repeat protein [Pirellulales bacterium]
MFMDERLWRIAAGLCLAVGMALAPAVVQAQQPQSPLKLPKTVEQAFETSKAATTDAQFTTVITLCRRGLELKLDARQAAYTRRLLAWAYNQRGEVRADAGDEQKALADFEQSLATLPGWRATHNRGVSYAACGKLDEALADFDQVIRSKQDFAPVWYNRAELRSQQGSYQAAIDDYRQALHLRPNDPAALAGRGYALYQLGKYEPAIADLCRSLELEPKQAATLVYRAAAYYETGRYGQAADDCRSAVRLDPNSPAAYQATGWLLATCPDERFRDAKLAVKAAQKAIELRGHKTYRDLETLAAALASDGQFQLAANTQRQAIAALPPHLAELSAEFKDRLKRYEHHQAYLETRVARTSSPRSTMAR